MRQYTHKRHVTVAWVALAVGLIGWLVQSRWSHTQQAAPKNVAVNLHDALDNVHATRMSYTLKDGTIVHGTKTASVTPAKATKSNPGNVDTLDVRAAYERAKRLATQSRGRTFKTRLKANWFAGNTQFWYRNDLQGRQKEFIVVNAAKGTRRRAFDHKKLAEALTKASGTKYSSTHLPFNSITFTSGNKAVQFRISGVTWECNLSSYECTRPRRRLPRLDDKSVEPALKQQQPRRQSFGRRQRGRVARSPDGAWTAFIKEDNIFVRDKAGRETQLTKNGMDTNAYGSLSWSPDAKTLIGYRRTPGNSKEVYMIETSPRDQLQARLHKRVYPRPGDKFTTYEMWLFRAADFQPRKVDVESINYRGPPRLRWSKDSTYFTFEKTDRGHQRFRIIKVDAQTGMTHNIIDEKAKTFIWTAHAPRRDMIPGLYVRYLNKTNEILYVSQRDGWKHMYLVDGKTGKFKNQITKGEWVVRAIDRIDEEKRQIWFRASGKNADQDPYLIHYYRVNFDGTGLVALTAGNGNHSIQYSPDGKYIIDTYSRVDMPPVHELRRVSDGTLVCALEKADISALLKTGWRAPEVFVAKGRDGKTDIWGIVCRPQNYDKNKKYPVIEYIYAGPHNSHVPKSFRTYYSLQALAELGFIVVQIDGMGTANRSRAFHDVCWKNIADAGFPDRILWIKALAKRYAYVDITRVGIYGTSAGGQNALGALLFHPEFYKVAVAACGCHDNRLDKASWNEQWMGLMGPHYKAQSNVTNAHKLQGKLLLIVGEMDTNVPFESTMRVVNALIRARKDFDLLFMPGVGHSSGGSYGQRRRWDFFVRHLHGVVPPNWNRDE